MTDRGDAPDLFDTVGGPAALRVAVEELYARVRADPALVDYFVDLDMVRLKTHQRAFIVAAVGGQEVPGGRELARAHRHLRISDADFDVIVRHVLDTLAGLGVATEVLVSVDDRLERLRPDIVTVPRTDLGVGR